VSATLPPPSPPDPPPADEPAKRPPLASTRAPAAPARAVPAPAVRPSVRGPAGSSAANGAGGGEAVSAELTVPAAYPGARPLRDAEPNSAPSPYIGLATRVLAVAVDAVVLNVVGWFAALIAGLCLSVLDLPNGVLDVFAAAGALIALLWTVGYFVFFWSTTGQTPGNRLLRIRVVDSTTIEAPSARRALLRFVLLPLSVIPLGFGMWLILVDDRRRALHDVLARTFVIDTADSDDIPRRHQRS
jgi:uncharacterized RDD family membrane protein YckC